MKARLNDERQLSLPQFCFPAIVTPLPGGGVQVKPGKAVELTEWIGVREGARLLGLSMRRVEAMCDEGALKEGTEWIRPGGGVKREGNYKISRAAVMRRIQGEN